MKTPRISFYKKWNKWNFEGQNYSEIDFGIGINIYKDGMRIEFAFWGIYISFHKN